MAAIGVSQSGSLNTDINKAKNAAASVFAILDRKSKIDSSDDSGTVLEILKGDIEFRHVSFNYPTRPDVLIFQDLCLAIHSGKVFYFFSFFFFNSCNTFSTIRKAACFNLR